MKDANTKRVSASGLRHHEQVRRGLGGRERGEGQTERGDHEEDDEERGGEAGIPLRP